MSSAQHIADRWRDAVSPGSPPYASDDLDLLPRDISLDFPLNGAFRGLNAPDDKAPGIIFFVSLLFSPISLFH